jgi:hypothetical protein
MSGDYMSGDYMSGDCMGGDCMGGDCMGGLTAGGLSAPLLLGLSLGARKTECLEASGLAGTECLPPAFLLSENTHALDKHRISDKHPQSR